MAVKTHARGWCAVAIAVSIGSSGFAHGADDVDEGKAERDRLKTLEKSIDTVAGKKRELDRAAAKVAREIGSLTEQMVSFANDIQSRERALTRIEIEIGVLKEQRQAQELSLAARRAEVAEVLAALQRLGQRPMELVLLRPATAIDTARSANLLSGVMPSLEQKAAVIREEIETLEALKADLARQEFQYRADLVRLAEERGKLEGLRQERERRREKLERLAKKEQSRLADLVAEAKSLKDLIAKLEEDAAETRRDEETAKLEVPELGPPSLAERPFSKRRGTLPYPAQGRILSGFGSRTTTGRARGVRIGTRPDAQVVALYDGKVAYAGPFRSYGQLLIIDHGEGYLSLLAGMVRIDPVVGQWVLAGEPVGIMGEAGAARASVGNPKQQSSASALYFELRKKGEPINPLPWLNASRG
ncbi:MAG: peptidoglycan DD-metalloendopeptidase family protein [Pseudomonadota bacterium]